MTITPLQALSRAVASLVTEHDLADTLATVISDACAALGARAAGVLLVRPDGGLEVLTATSHRTLDLELYQAQERQGPCVDAVQSAEAVIETGADNMARRWPQLASQTALAGYDGVQAHPMRWHGEALGAMNFYHQDHGTISEQDLATGQDFADIATLLLLMPDELGPREISDRIAAALETRTGIEIAKGVLMHAEQLTAEQAYDRLMSGAKDGGHTLSKAAADIVTRAHSNGD